ncbi:hypothetical protein Tco_1153061 [Tanacetum coccineum]
MPVGVEVDRSANSSIILVLVNPWRLSFSKTESGIRFMLAPRSARAKHSSNSGKSHGMTTGSFTWTIGGWTSLVLPLDTARAPLSPQFQLSTTGGGYLSSQNQFLTHPKLDERELAIPTVLVLVPTILIVSLAVVLHGRKTEWSDLVCHRWRAVTGISLVEKFCLRSACETLFLLAHWRSSACEKQMLNHIFQLQQTFGRHSGDGSASLQIRRGLLSKSYTPAAGVQKMSFDLNIKALDKTNVLVGEGWGSTSKSQPLISFELLWRQSQPSKCFGNGEGLPTWTLYSWGEVVGDLGSLGISPISLDVNLTYLHNHGEAFATRKSKAKVANSDKKKQPAKKPKAKGLAVLSEVALTKVEQLKLATKRSKTQFHNSHASGSGDGVDTQSKVPNEQQQKTSSTYEGTGTIPGVPDVPIYDLKRETRVCQPQKFYEEEEEENIDDEETMYDDEDDEVPQINNVSQQSGFFKQAEEDAHVTITQSMSLKRFNERVFNLEQDLSEIKQVDQYAQALSSIPAIVDRYIDNKLGEAIKKANQAHNLDYRQEAQDEKNAYIELANTSMRAIIKEEVNTYLPQMLPQAVSDFASPSTYEAATSLSEFELTKIFIDKMEKNKSYDKADYKRKLYDALIKSYETDKDLFDSYGELFTLKRNMDDKDKDQDPSVGSDRGTKRRKSSKDAESSRDSRSKEKKSSSTSKDASQSQHKLNIKDLTQEILVGPAFNLLKGTCKSLTELEYHLEECSKAITERLDWHNPEGKPYPFDLHKPLPLIPNHRGHQVIPQDFFINNDLEYLKARDLSRCMPTGVLHIGGPKRQHFYGFGANMTSSKDVYSRKWIITVTRLLNMKKYDYGHLEEIEVYRDDKKLYKFREGDFQRLRLQDIEDMLLLLVQQKLTNLTIDERYDLNVALHMFTRRIVIQRRVEDLQLGVESYQKKLNLTKPDTFKSNLGT